LSFCTGFTISGLAGTLHKSAKTDKNAKRFHLVRFNTVELNTYLHGDKYPIRQPPFITPYATIHTIAEFNVESKAEYTA